MSQVSSSKNACDLTNQRLDAVYSPDYRRGTDHHTRDADADADEKVIYPDYRRHLEHEARDAEAKSAIHKARRDAVAEDDEKVIYPDY